MKKFTKILAVVLAVLMLVMAAGCSSVQSVEKIKKAGKLVILTEATFAPFEYIAGGKPSGVDIDIAAEIAKDLGVELEVKDMNFKGIVDSVKKGKGDLGIAGMTVTEERLLELDFSKEYYKSSQVVIVKKGSDVTLDNLKDKVIGVQEGTTGDFYATDDIKGDPNTADVKRYNNAVIASQDLANGKVDAVIIDQLPAQNIVKSNADLEILDGVLTEESYAIAVQKNNPTLLEAVNKTLDRLFAEGKIDEFVLKHSTAQAQ